MLRIRINILLRNGWKSQKRSEKKESGEAEDSCISDVKAMRELSVSSFSGEAISCLPQTITYNVIYAKSPNLHE